MQFVPLMVYFGMQKLVKDETVMTMIPEAVAGWLPIVCAVLTFVISNKVSQANASKETEKLIGEDAPDFDLKLKDKTTTLKKFITETGLPTVIDFYQNF